MKRRSIDGSDIEKLGIVQSSWQLAVSLSSDGGLCVREGGLGHLDPRVRARGGGRLARRQVRGQVGLRAQELRWRIKVGGGGEPLAQGRLLL